MSKEEANKKGFQPSETDEKMPKPVNPETGIKNPNVEEVNETGDEAPEEPEENEESEEVKIKGGMIMLRTEDDGVIFQPYENFGIVDLTIFSEYLNKLKDTEWSERIKGGQIED